MAGTAKYLIIAAAALATPLAAHAQEAAGAPIGTGIQGSNTIDSGTYDRGRNTGVLDRERPDYQALGHTNDADWTNLAARSDCLTNDMQIRNPDPA